MTFAEWWDWELELTPHVEKRMEDHTFTEVDLRLMTCRLSPRRLHRGIAAVAAVSAATILSFKDSAIALLQQL